VRTLRPARRSLACARLGRSQMALDELRGDFCAAHLDQHSQLRGTDLCGVNVL
jgi:hypothetical protein